MDVDTLKKDLTDIYSDFLVEQHQTETNSLTSLNDFTKVMESLDLVMRVEQSQCVYDFKDANDVCDAFFNSGIEGAEVARDTIQELLDESEIECKEDDTVFNWQGFMEERIKRNILVKPVQELLSDLQSFATPIGEISNKFIEVNQIIRTSIINSEAFETVPTKRVRSYSELTELSDFIKTLKEGLTTFADIIKTDKKLTTENHAVKRIVAKLSDKETVGKYGFVLHENKDKSISFQPVMDTEISDKTEETEQSLSSKGWNVDTFKEMVAKSADCTSLESCLFDIEEMEKTFSSEESEDEVLEIQNSQNKISSFTNALNLFNELFSVYKHRIEKLNSDISYIGYHVLDNIKQ